MKIAFTSCMNIIQMPSQPVWQQIAALQPDFLVLLGDSVYADVPVPQINGNTKTVEQMSVQEFMEHMHGLYRRQLAEPRFAALIQKVPTLAIWDDHDFLGNNSHGGGLSPAMKGHVRVSRALFNAYRRALSARDPQRFPAKSDAAELNRDDEPAPGYQAIALSDQVHLHLSDGRSEKNTHQLLGAAQRNAIKAHIRKHPQALHLFASSTVFQGPWFQECWSHFPEDFDWLRDLARQARMILLSGDIHQNNIQAHELAKGKSLHELTASGAAITFPLLKPLRPTHNFGLLEVQAGLLQAWLFSNQSSVPTHTLSLATAQL